MRDVPSRSNESECRQGIQPAQIASANEAF
jgi:hypothetical protein